MHIYEGQSIIMLVNIAALLPGIIAGLIGGLAALAIKRANRRAIERAEHRQAASDAEALAARMAEAVAASQELDATAWPHDVPPALEDHLHRWGESPNGALDANHCFCGAYRQGKKVTTFTRGTVITVNGEWHRIQYLNVIGCMHWVLDGFPEDERMGQYRHFTIEQLFAAQRGEKVDIDA